MPGPAGDVPPIPTNIFLLTSMSFELRCQCPMVTPASLGVKGCAQAAPLVRADVSNSAANNRVMATSQLGRRSREAAVGAKGSTGAGGAEAQSRPEACVLMFATSSAFTDDAFARQCGASWRDDIAEGT